MTPRRVLLTIMLVALAASALTGTLAALASSVDVLWKTLGTAMTTAVTTALLLPLSLLTDRPKLRAGGLTAMCVLLVCWGCVLAMIWLPSHFSSGYFDVEWRLAATIGFTLLMGLPAAAALLLLNVKWVRSAAWVEISLAAYAFLLCVAGAWLTDGSRFFEKLLGTGLIPYGMGTLIAVLLVNIGRDRRYFRWVGILAGIVATAIAVAAVWSQSDNELWGRLCGISLSICLVLAHINLVLMARLRAAQEWLKWGTIACSLGAGASAVAGLLTVGVDDFFRTGDAGLFRTGSAAAIAAACGSLALIVLSMLNRRVEAAVQTTVEMKDIALACPRCGVKQTLPLGEAACRSCELQIFVKVVEPRCPACGYLLYKLTSARCPECGAVVRPGEAPPAGPAFPIEPVRPA